MWFVERGWHGEFIDALRADASELRIICPFIKARAIGSLLSCRPTMVRVITRFNLADFAEGVSDVDALQQLLDVGGRVRGVRNLHAKLYLFGESRAIITSANLTESALRRNYEFGVVADDAKIIEQCRAYFDSLWQNAGSDLERHQVNAWEEVIIAHRVRGGRTNEAGGLADFGVDAGLPDPPSSRVPLIVADAPHAFVKLLGTGSDRLSLTVPTITEIENSGCHWAVGYPRTKRPAGVNDGAVIFIGRLTQDPNDIRVFGRAIGMKHQPGRDDATPADIEHRPWKETWPRYIRVHDAEFVAGAMANGVSLKELMDNLEADVFLSTQRNAAEGQGNINPRFAYRQQAHVQLSVQGFSWLSQRLQAAFDAHGKVPEDTLDNLDWPSL